MTAVLSPGFADPVTDAQCCFRSVLDAMARPGQVHRVGGVDPPAPLCAAAGAVLLTLVDHETRLWLDPDTSTARDWIAFHCGAPFSDPGRAVFALALSLPDLASLPAGRPLVTLLWPDCETKKPASRVTLPKISSL